MTLLFGVGEQTGAEEAGANILKVPSAQQETSCSCLLVSSRPIHTLAAAVSPDTMLRRAVQLLPSSLRALSQPSLQRGFADLNLQDPAILKKFVGIEEALGVVEDPRGELTKLLQDLQQSLQSLPESSEYRRATEATTQYRLKVLEQNDSNQAVEEVLDAHMEELLLETREEMALVPLMSSKWLGFYQTGRQ